MSTPEIDRLVNCHWGEQKRKDTNKIKKVNFVQLEGKGKRCWVKILLSVKIVSSWELGQNKVASAF